MIVEKNISLQAHHTLNLKVSAAYFFYLSSVSQISPLSKIISQRFSSFPLVLGQGSNVFFSQNFRGLVVKNEIKGIKILRQNTRYIFVEVAGGVLWDDLVLWSLRQDLGGLENLSMIPGTVGAAPVQNIGAYGVEVKDYIDRIQFFEWRSQKYRVFYPRDCGFVYRSSIFKEGFRDQGMIVSVTFRLKKKPHDLKITYSALAESIKKISQKRLTIQQVSACVRAIRASKLPNPVHLPNGGSFFKNPVVSLEKLEGLKERYSDIPHFKLDISTYCKLSAAWLIDKAGFRGLRQKGVAMYHRQPLVLVNYGSTSQIIMQYIHRVQERVYDYFGVELVPEVRIV